MGTEGLALVLVLVALAGCGGADDEPVAGGSTLRGTLVDPDRDGALERGPAEPLVDRGGRGAPGAALTTLVQLTDLHVRDEESPGRVPFLDRLGSPFGSTFRPQEALSTQVLAAAVRAANAVGPDAAFVTGDLLDSASRAELAMALAVLDGGDVDPDTGRPGYEGVQEAAQPDPLFYRPDLDAPRRPGLLARAARPFRSPGLRAPWYPALGNHDLLVQGETPADRAARRVRRGRPDGHRPRPRRPRGPRHRCRRRGPRAPRRGRTRPLAHRVARPGPPLPARRRADRGTDGPPCRAARAPGRRRARHARLRRRPRRRRQRARARHRRPRRRVARPAPPGAARLAPGGARRAPATAPCSSSATTRSTTPRAARRRSPRWPRPPPRSSP